MNRRSALSLLTGLAVLPAWAHTPYRQWAVFRQRFLLITTTRDDLPGDDLGEVIAGILLRQLPASNAQVSRARDWRTQANLLVTRQTEIAILPHDRALALSTGAGSYSDYGQVPLRTLVQTGRHCMVCHPDFPDHHAYLLSETLVSAQDPEGFAIPVRAGDGPLPGHRGALLFAQGEALPPAPGNMKEVPRAQ